MRIVGCRIIFTIDNAVSHSTEGLRLIKFVFKFPPPNTTAHIQPMDVGINRDFKGHFRKLLVRYFLLCIEDGEEQKVSTKLAINYDKEAWSLVKQSTIASCWRHVDILSPFQEIETDAGDTDDLPLAELQRLLQPVLPGEDRITRNDYVSIDNTFETGDSLNDESNLDLIMGSRAADDLTTNDIDDANDDEPVV